MNRVYASSCKATFKSVLAKAGQTKLAGFLFCKLKAGQHKAPCSGLFKHCFNAVYEAQGCCCTHIIQFFKEICWGERRGLNPRPPVPQTGALPAELRPPHSKRTFRENCVVRQSLLAFLYRKISSGGFSTVPDGPQLQSAPPHACKRQSESGCAGVCRFVHRKRQMREWW